MYVVLSFGSLRWYTKHIKKCIQPSIFWPNRLRDFVCNYLGLSAIPLMLIQGNHDLQMILQFNKEGLQCYNAQTLECPSRFTILCLPFVGAVDSSFKAGFGSGSMALMQLLNEIQRKTEKKHHGTPWFEANWWWIPPFQPTILILFLVNHPVISGFVFNRKLKFQRSSILSSRWKSWLKTLKFGPNMQHLIWRFQKRRGTPKWSIAFWMFHCKPSSPLGYPLVN